MLEGGLPAWKAAGQATEAGAVPDARLHAATAAARAPPAGGARYIAHLQRDKVWPLQGAGASGGRRRASLQASPACNAPCGLAAPGRGCCLLLTHGAQLPTAAHALRQVIPLEQMRALVGGGGAQIADARPPGRFKGVDPEPRPGLRRGHMPGAKSMPFTQVGQVEACARRPGPRPGCQRALRASRAGCAPPPSRVSMSDGQGFSTPTHQSPCPLGPIFLLPHPRCMWAGRWRAPG